MTVRGLLQSLDSEELTEWMAFERLEGFGALADDFRAGQIASAAFNARRTKKDDPMFTVSDFMPQFKRAVHGEPEPEPERVKADPITEAQFLDAMFGFQ